MKINETEHNLTECDNFYDPMHFFADIFTDSLSGLIMKNAAKMYSKLKENYFIYNDTFFWQNGQ